MLQEIISTNNSDEHGNPAGGTASAKGLTVRWQNGPLGRGAQRKEPNGVFVETLIALSIERIAFYQGSKFKCDENQVAINHLKSALAELETRTARREAEGSEGTHKEDTKPEESSAE